MSKGLRGSRYASARIHPPRHRPSIPHCRTVRAMAGASRIDPYVKLDIRVVFALSSEEPGVTGNSVNLPPTLNGRMSGAGRLLPVSGQHPAVSYVTVCCLEDGRQIVCQPRADSRKLVAAAVVSRPADRAGAGSLFMLSVSPAWDRSAVPSSATASGAPSGRAGRAHL